MSAGRKQIALAGAIAALVAGFRGPVQAAPTTVTVPNYNFQSYDEAVCAGAVGARPAASPRLYPMVK